MYENSSETVPEIEHFLRVWSCEVPVNALEVVVFLGEPA